MAKNDHTQRLSVQLAKSMVEHLRWSSDQLHMSGSELLTGQVQQGDAETVH